MEVALQATAGVFSSEVASVPLMRFSPPARAPLAFTRCA